jgi:hypothetical protein
MPRLPRADPKEGPVLDAWAFRHTRSAMVFSSDVCLSMKHSAEPTVYQRASLPSDWQGVRLRLNQAGDLAMTIVARSVITMLHPGYC